MSRAWAPLGPGVVALALAAVTTTAGGCDARRGAPPPAGAGPAAALAQAHAARAALERRDDASRRELVELADRYERLAEEEGAPRAVADEALAAAALVEARLAGRSGDPDDLRRARAATRRALARAGAAGEGAGLVMVDVALAQAALELERGEPARAAEGLAPVERLGGAGGRRAREALAALAALGLSPASGSGDGPPVGPIDPTALHLLEAAPGTPPARLERVGRLSAPGFARLVLHLDRAVRFARTLAPADGAEPPRVVLDLLDAEPGPGLPAREALGAGLVRALRVERAAPGRTRVVLEAAVEVAASAFPLGEPFRIVVDVAPAAVPAPPAPLTLSEAAGLRVRRVAVDAGHGGADAGAVGAGGLSEKEVTLDVARRLGGHLRRAGLEVVLTRDADETVPLEARAARANAARADLLVSIHANAAADRAVDGVETYVLDVTDDAYARRLAARENASSERGVADLGLVVADLAARAGVEDSLLVAAAVQRALVAGLRGARADLPDRGVRRALLAVLLGAKMPAVMVEAPFLTHPEGERLLASPDGRERVAAAVAAGVRAYLGGREARLGAGGGRAGR